METKLIDYLVPRPETSTEAVYDQLDLLRALYSQIASDPERTAISSMLEAVINWADQIES